MRARGGLHASLVLVALGAGCSVQQVINAGINTGIAATAAGVRRARGDCYSPCDHGNTCNPETGLCERTPCDEPCDEHEICVREGLESRCEGRFMLDGEHEPDADESDLTADEHGSPQIGVDE